MRKISVLRILVLLALAVLPTPAAAADCTMAQLQVSSFSVIEPCTKDLEVRTLSDVERSQLHFVRGRGYHRTKQLDEAREDYRAAFRLNPKNEEILVSWSNVDLRQGRGREYAERVEQAYDLNPGNAHVLRAVGAMFENFGDIEKAMEFYGKALSVNPAEPFVLYFRSGLLKKQRRFMEAIADADALLAIPRRTLDEYGFLDLDGVIKDFHVAALINRAEIHETAGRTDLAKWDFDAAVAEERSARTLLARGWFSRGFPERRAEALADLEAAAQLEPKDDGVQYALGMVLASMKRFDDAIRAFSAAAEANPRRGLYLVMRAYMHRQLGNTELAVGDFEEAFARDPREIGRSMPALRAAGYWTSRQDPREITPELRDAIRACMMDIRC